MLIWLWMASAWSWVANIIYRWFKILFQIKINFVSDIFRSSFLPTVNLLLLSTLSNKDKVFKVLFVLCQFKENFFLQKIFKFFVQYIQLCCIANLKYIGSQTFWYISENDVKTFQYFKSLYCIVRGEEFRLWIDTAKSLR